MPEKQLCPVCGKVVGAWHKSGVHPKCDPEQARVTTVEQREAILRPSFKNPDGVDLFDGRPIGVGMTQAQRDAILRGVNTTPKRR